MNGCSLCQANVDAAIAVSILYLVGYISCGEKLAAAYLNPTTSVTLMLYVHYVRIILIVNHGLKRNVGGSVLLVHIHDACWLL